MALPWVFTNVGNPVIDATQFNDNFNYLEAEIAAASIKRTKMLYTANAHVTKVVNADTSVSLTADAAVYGLECDASIASRPALGLAKTLIVSGWIMKLASTGEDPGFIIQRVGGGGYWWFWSGSGMVLYRYAGDAFAGLASSPGLIVNIGTRVGGAIGEPVFVELSMFVHSTSSILFHMRFDDTLQSIRDSTAIDFTGSAQVGRMINASNSATAWGESYFASDAYSYPSEVT